MKKLFLLSVLLISLVTFAQVPQGISYQAIALNGSGSPVVSSNVRVKLSILDNTASGTVLYSETQVKTTNAQGLFNLIIGQGTLVSGAFNTINWGTNSKFLKVEMDATGGTNYALVGTTQLLSVPYALAADSLVTSAGEGITLVSPNGTPYQLTVNDSGQLSLPTSGVTGTVPNSLYMYGSFNSFNASTALLMTPLLYNGGVTVRGYKYLTAGTQIKFLSGNDAGATVYGVNSSLNLTLNGSAYTVPSNGFYYILFSDYEAPVNSISEYNFSADSIAATLYLENTGNNINATYNVGTNTFSFTVNGVTNTTGSFIFLFNSFLGGYGDNLSDGTIEAGGTSIVFPNVTSTPKNFRVDLTINFNGSGTYTITQIP
ncbi:hypothetical protein [Flavobacterium sp. XGLA_31]|uniref:hypothetical protein n=1 Tax=Flavobacterium sp. XGLA_31 TaxID=3447666 RepID=UPI003F2BAFBF